MADIDVLGIKFELRGMEDGIRNLEKMDKVTDEVQATLKQLKKSLEEIGKASGESYKDQVAAVQKLATAKKQLEEASKKQAEAEVARAKARKIEASIDEKALDGKVRRENAYAKALDQSAQREQVLQKQKAQTAAAEELANERRQKAAHWEQKRLDTSSLLAAQESRLTNQNLVALERLNTYKLNQMSMIETRQLKANASIEQGAARLALQQEKFEYQKQRAAERAANGSVSAWQKFKDTMSTISDVTIGGFGIGMVVDKLSGVVKAADEMVLLDSRLKLATKSSADFAEAQSRLRQSAVETGLSITAQTANYTQIERSTRSMGLSVQQLSFLTESFGKAAVVSGADAESFKSAITQLNQGFASGVVRGQEFNSVAEQAPAIMEALANGLRGSNKEFDELEKKGILGVAALRKMAAEGKLVNGVTLPALMEGLKLTNEQFEKMPLTVERAFGMLSNKYKIWIADQNNATQSTSLLANAIKGLADNLGPIISGLGTAAAVLGTVFGARLISSFTEARVKGVQGFLEIRQANIQAAAAADIWAANTAKGVEVARKQLDIAQKTQGNTKALEAATLNLAAATAKHNIALGEQAAAHEKVSIKANLAAKSVQVFNAGLSLVGGWVGVAVIALTTLITYWDEVAAKLGSVKAKADLARDALLKAVGANDFRGAKSELDAIDALYKKQEDRLLRINAEVRKYTSKNMPVPETLLANQKRTSEELAVTRKTLNDSRQAYTEGQANQREQALRSIDKYGQTPIKGGPTPEQKTKKTPLPDETLGSDAALRNLERSLSLRQSAVEKEKQLLGYSSEENLAQLASMESRKLSLQWQQEEQKLSEESKKKMTTEARKQHNEVVAGFQAEKKIQLESLLVMQERRRLDNEEAKAKLTINSLNENAINAAKAEYAVAKERTSLDLSALDMAERMGDVAGSVAAERKKELEISLQLTKNQVDMAKALAEEKVAQEAYNRAKANADVYGKEEVERRRQALLSAEDTVEAVKQENIALKEQLELEKKLSILRTDGLSGAKKAISDYIDGLDNWYQTGYNIANESINLLEDAFTSFIETGKLSGAKLFKYLRDEFKKLAVQRIIIQPIMSGASNILSSLGSTFSGNFSGIASLANVASGLSGVGSMIGGGLSGAAFNGASAFATSSVGQWLGLSETTAEVGTIMTEAGTTLANAADLASQYGGYAKAAYDVFNAFKEGTGWGAAAGSAIGAYFGGAPGAFIGNKIGGFVDKTFSGGGGQKVGGEGAVGTSNLGLFPEGQTDALVQDALVSYQTSLKDVAKKFGVSLDNMSVAYGYETDPQGSAGNFFSSKATLNGASIREVIAQKYEGEVADQMAKEFKTITVLALSGAGLKEDFQAAFKDFDVKNVTQEAVDKVVARLDEISVVVEAFDKFGDVFPQLTNLSITAKEGIISLAGGLDSLSTKLNAYYENFYSQEEQLAIKTSALAKEFENIGTKMPATRAEFRKLVEAQDLNTESGRKAYTSLLNVANAFAEVVPAAEDAADALDTLSEAVKAAERAGDKAADAYKTALNDWEEATKTFNDNYQAALDKYKTNLDTYKNTISHAKDVVSDALQYVLDALTLEQEALTKSYNTAVEKRKKKLEDDELLLQQEFDAKIKILEEEAKQTKQKLSDISKMREEALNPLKTTVSVLTEVFNLLNEKVKDLDANLTKSQRKTGISRLVEVAGVAEKGGGLEPFAAELKDLVPKLTADNQDLYSSFEEWSIDQARIAAATKLLGGSAKQQLSTAELHLQATEEGFDKTTKDLEAMIEANDVSQTALKQTLESKLSSLREVAEQELTQMQLDYEFALAKFEEEKKHWKEVAETALGTNRAILSVSDAIVGLQGAIRGLETAMKAVKPVEPTKGTEPTKPVDPTKGNTGNTGGKEDDQTVIDRIKRQTAISELYRSIMGREADPVGLDWYVSSNKTLEEIAKDLNFAKPMEDRKLAISQLYRDIMGREADEPGLNFYASSSKTLDEIAADLRFGKVNGSHANGLPYVPFDGYRAELHKGERVLTKSEAEQYAKGDEETRSLLRELIEICKSTTRNTFYIEKKLDNWDGNGLPATRVV